MTFHLREHFPTIDASKGIAHVHLEQHFVGLGVLSPQSDLTCGSFRGIWDLNSDLLGPQVLGCLRNDDIHEQLASESPENISNGDWS